jgi:hypothetical protein
MCIAVGKDHQREVIIELAFDDLIGGPDDQFSLFLGQCAEVHVDLGRGLLENAHGANQFARHALAADAEVFQ